jgi:hypothetical protein
VGLWKATKKSADVAKPAANTANNQFNLTKQQLEYTQSANLRIGISVGFPPIGARIYPDPSNIGHEPASAPVMDLQLRKKPVSNQLMIGKPRTWDIPVHCRESGAVRSGLMRLCCAHFADTSGTQDVGLCWSHFGQIEGCINRAPGSFRLARDPRTKQPPAGMGDYIVRTARNRALPSATRS